VSTQRSRGATVRGRPLSSTCRARVYPRLKGHLHDGVELFGIAKRIAERRRRAALKRLDLSNRSRAPLSEERGVTPIPLRVRDLEVLRQLGETELADELLADWEQWKAKHPALRAPVQGTDQFEARRPVSLSKRSAGGRGLPSFISGRVPVRIYA
jgi:hypothetical protein